ncbi:unnamed protein product [Caenorhabditis nigoni]
MRIEEGIRRQQEEKNWRRIQQQKQELDVGVFLSSLSLHTLESLSKSTSVLQSLTTSFVPSMDAPLSM